MDDGDGVVPRPRRASGEVSVDDAVSRDTRDTRETTGDLLAQLSSAAARVREAGLDDVESDEAPPAAQPTAIELLGLEGPRPKREWRRLPRMVLLAARMVWRAARWRAVTVAVLQAVSALGIGAQLLAGNDLLQRAIAIRGSGGDIGELVPSAVTIGAISAVVALLSAIAGAQDRVVSELVGTHAFEEVMRTSAAVDLVHFEDPAFYDRLQRAATGANFRPWMLSNGLLMLVGALLGSVGIAIALAALQPLLVVLAVASALPVWIATTRNAQANFRVVMGNTPDERERRYLQDILVTRDPAKEVRAFNLVGYLQRRHDTTSARILSRLKKEAGKQLLRTLGGRVGGGAGAIASGGALLWLLVRGHLTIAAAVTAAIAIQQLRGRITGIVSSSANIFESALYLEDYAAFLAMRPAEAADGTGGPAKVAKPAAFECLRAEGVSFSYPGAAQPALSAVDVEVHAGQVVALVGENGSGKTTLAKLLCGLYEPSAGRVTWDGADARELDGYGMRDQMAVIFQDFIRYALPARDNVGLGRHERIEDDESIRAAAKLAGIGGAFDQLGSGWDTVLGRQFMGGQDLSGGQWQRVALARAFFRDAPFLVLDEPTAALDARAEFRLFDRLRDLARGRAVLLITHRFGNVRMADFIYVLHKGRVEEAGTHDELLTKGGRYAELFSLQAAQLLGLGGAR